MKKNVLVGITAGLLMLIVGFVAGQLFQLLFPSIKTEYATQGLFRPWSDPLMSVIFVQPFITAFILAWLWKKTQHAIIGRNDIEKGLNFGFIYWVVGISGMVISYATFPVSFIMIVGWSLQGFLQAIIAGIVFSKMLK